MVSELIVLLEANVIGHVQRTQKGSLEFVYKEEWRNADDSYPLSLSMPISAARHRHKIVDAFLWGLLPDNQFILNQWGKRFQVSARNAFSLMTHVGEDCAGAVQFVRPERLKSCLQADIKSVDWLDEEDVAKRLKLLREDHSAWRVQKDTGQFSLAGAQPKTAFLFQEGKWGVPEGSVPTSHILKPPTLNLDGHNENEHFCLSLARQLEIPAAVSRIQKFKDEIAIVVERYDRYVLNDELRRVHQEDMCQALAIPPTLKYENEGGPGAEDVIELLRSSSSNPNEDVSTFLDALIFNWLIAGTDAHAKNYSLLIGKGGVVRLAPLYDLASALPYEVLDFQKLKLAMRVHKKYRVRDIGMQEWEKFAAAIRFDQQVLIQRIAELAEQIPDAARVVYDQMKSQDLDHPLVKRLHDCVVERARL